MKTLQDIEDLEDSGWGHEEIIREIEIRRGLTRSGAQQWMLKMRGVDLAAVAMHERAEMAHDWKREQ